MRFCQEIAAKRNHARPQLRQVSHAGTRLRAKFSDAQLSEIYDDENIDGVAGALGLRVSPESLENLVLFCRLSGLSIDDTGEKAAKEGAPSL